MGRLHEAARNPAAKIEPLIEGAAGTIDEKDGMGYTPLHYAARAGNSNAANALLDAGADIEATTKKGQTALYHAVVALEVSMAELLIDRRANVNAQMTSGFVPLHIAAREGATNLLRLLLLAGADVERETLDGNTAFVLAQKAGQHSAVRLFELFAATGRIDAPAPGTSMDDDDLMAELDALEEKPAVKYAAGTSTSRNVPISPTETGAQAPEGYGVVQTWGENGAPPPELMQYRAGKGATATRQKFTGELPAGAKVAAAPAAGKPSRAPRPRNAPPSDHVVPEPAENALPGGDRNSVVGVCSASGFGAAADDLNEIYDNADANPPVEPVLPFAEPDYDNADANPPVEPTLPFSEPDYDNADANPNLAEVPSEPDYAEVAAEGGDAGDAGTLVGFLSRLGLAKCVDLCDAAGIDEPCDFKMFAEAELVAQHGFKVGHARKILAAL